MDPSDKTAARFYEIFKMHKPHPPKSTPPGRPIISGSGCITEKISHFVQHHIKKLSTTHPSYVQDTPDMLRVLEDIDTVPANAVFCTIDVSALYTNIPRTDGIEAVRDILNTRESPSVPTDFIVKLLNLVLKWNIFEFNGELYQQMGGTAMGTRCAPNYADIFMAVIDISIKRLAAKYGDGVYPLFLYKRFLDDILMIFTGPTDKLHEFLADINNIHPSIKFTMSHTKPEGVDTCDCPAADNIPFLDTSLSLKNNKIVSDLYRKACDKNQYLLPSSCHPGHCWKNIPYSLAMRIIRICSEPESRDMRLSELKNMLLERNYPRTVINSAIRKALAVPRSEALERREKPKVSDRPVFTVLYDPHMPPIAGIMRTHWKTMVITDPLLKETFPKPPLVAYRRPAYLRQKLIRSKVPPILPNKPKRQNKGMRKCLKFGRGCPVCPFVETTATVKATATNVVVPINTAVDCQDTNIIYCITCNVCKQQYVGTTEHSFQTRISQHRDYIKNRDFKQPTGRHFNQRGHSLSDFSATILEKVYNPDKLVREQRESNFIRKGE